MAYRLSMKLDSDELQAAVKAMLARGDDLRPYHKKLGAWMLKSVDKNWRAQGRPKKWKELSDMTLAIRRWRADKYGSPAYTEKILEIGGELRGHGWEYRARRVAKGQESLEVGTPHPKADIHHEGKTVPAPKRWKLRKTVKIPKRTLIVIQREDWDAAKRFADGHIKHTVPGAA